MTHHHLLARQRYRAPLVVVGFVLAIALAGCTMTRNDPTPTNTPAHRVTATATSVPTIQSTTATTPVPTLASDTGPYDNVTYLLSGVCFEYLYAQNDRRWTWQSLAEMAAFFAAAEDSGLCPATIRAPTFEFGDQVLAGAIVTARGCDAAFRYVRESRDTATGSLVVHVRLVTQPGCEYDLVQPVVVAVPRPSDGSQVTIDILP